MIAANNPEIDVEQLMSRIREEAARRKQSARSQPASAGSVHGQGEGLTTLERVWTPSPGHSLQPKFIPHPDHRYTLDDLLRFHDRDFVVNAYVAILRRSADAHGLDHYLNLIRQGNSKIAILGRLRYSPEGRRQGVKVRGLASRFFLDMLYRTPLLGQVLQTFAVLAHLPGLERNQRRFEAYAIQQWEMQNHRVNEQDGKLQAGLPLLRTVIAEKLAVLEEQVQHLEARDPQPALDTLAGQLQELQGIKADRGMLEDMAAQWRENDQQLRSEVAAQLRSIDERKAEAAQVTDLANHMRSIDERKAEAAQVTDLANRFIAALESKVDQATLAELRQTLEAKLGAEQWRQELTDIRRQILDHKHSIIDQQRRLALLLEEARRRLPEPFDAGQLATFSAEADHVLDAMYVSFEDDFRGTRADIKQRLSAYLPSLPPGVGSSFAPAVDLGCGRGEWLELLKEHDLAATGIDLNRIMAECCRDRGLTVVEADALTYLREQPDNSLGLITGFHIIEHLPLRTLVALFDEALRVLKPGGLVIFETPNPENLVVGACNFYMDPTHRNPMPPMMTQFLVEARGFVRVEIRRMNQQVLNDPLRLLESGTPGAAELNPLIHLAKAHYFTAPDYAVVGYKA